MSEEPNHLVVFQPNAEIAEWYGDGVSGNPFAGLWDHPMGWLAGLVVVILGMQEYRAMLSQQKVHLNRRGWLYSAFF